MLKLAIKEIVDRYIQRNFEDVRDFCNTESKLQGFGLVDVVFTEAGTQKAAHGLGGSPLDVVLLRASDGATVTWNYASFDETYVSLTVSGACRVRAFVGTYRSNG